MARKGSKEAKRAVQLTLMIIRKPSYEKSDQPVASEETCELARQDKRVLPCYDRLDRKGRLVRRKYHPQGRSSSDS